MCFECLLQESLLRRAGVIGAATMCIIIWNGIDKKRVGRETQLFAHVLQRIRSDDSSVGLTQRSNIMRVTLFAHQHVKTAGEIINIKSLLRAAAQNRFSKRV